MKTLTLFFALGFAAAAQTTTNVPTVTLSGPVSDPVIVNHSGKSVIAAMVILTDAEGLPWVQQRLFTHDSLGLEDGATETLATFSKHQKLKSPIVSAKITAVIFADGEYRGEDSNDFQENMERHLQSMRQSWQLAKDGNWAALKAKAESTHVAHDSFGIVTAIRLLDAHDNGKDAAGTFPQFGLIPTTIWRSGLLNKLQIPDVFQAITAGWRVA